ncbi:integrase/recombinase XerD [Lentisphaera araneosa HTCC2155]|uniref:Integrase/recombinase XerD n=2 Tax=Lentisphaera TaxID=256846 RepID=A6DNY8_9BACT|nr:integrase/recombinase XerD [Lentisphaera araneosa HTCC2155]
MARAKGLGNIFKRGNIYYLRFTVNGKKKVVSLKTPNKAIATKEAEKYLSPQKASNEAEAAEFIAKAKGLISTERISLDDAWDLYFKSKRRRDSGKSTITSYKQHLQKFVRFVEAEYDELIYLDELTPKVAEEFLESLKVSPNTYNKYKNFLKLYFDTVSKDCGVTKNPFEGIISKSLKKESWRELNDDEVDKLTSYPKGEVWVLMNLGIYTGMRLKDAALLKWADVDLKREKIIFTPWKTAKSEKVVHVPILPELRKALQWVKQQKLSNDLVLPEMAASYQKSRTNLSSLVKRIFIDLKIRDGKVGFHSLRHTFVSTCAKAGVPMSVVQAIVGHGSPAMTRHYTHIDIESARKWLEPKNKEVPKIEINELFALVESMNKSNWKELKKEILSKKN